MSGGVRHHSAGTISGPVRQLLCRADDEFARGNWQASRHLFLAAITIDEREDARLAYAAALADRDEWNSAFRQLHQSLDSARRRRDPLSRARCCHALANLNRRLGHTVEATQYRQLAISAELEGRGTVSLVPWLTDHLDDALATADPGIARDLAAHLQWIPPSTRSSEALCSLAVYQARCGRASQALRTFSRAFRSLLDERDLRGCRVVAMNVGHLLRGYELLKRASVCFSHAARIFQRIGATEQLNRARQYRRECDRSIALAQQPAEWN